MRLIKSALPWTLVVLAGWAITGGAQQLPLEPIKERGQGVYPVYEGWYKNADGSYTFLLGYFNRNAKEAIDVPIGPDNKVEPGGPDLGQPTHFEPRRGWGVFTIKVPADFGTKKLVWTINVNGLNASVPMHLDPNWFVEPFEDAASLNRPPALRFEPSGRPFLGPPDGIRAELTTTVGEPLELTLYAKDVKPTTNLGQRTRPNARERLDITWTKFRGPGHVVFAEPHAGGGEAGRPDDHDRRFRSSGRVHPARRSQRRNRRGRRRVSVLLDERSPAGERASASADDGSVGRTS